MKKNTILSFFRGKANCLLKNNLKMKLSVLLMVFSILQVFPNKGYSQKKVSFNLKDVTIKEVFNEIQNQTDFKFLYRNTVVNVNSRVSLKAKNKTTLKVLDRLFRNTQIEYQIIEKQIVLTKKELPLINSVFKDQTKEIKGRVTDSDGHPLPGASIVEKGTANGIQSDFDGKFSLGVADENAILVISFLGYITQEIKLEGKTEVSILMSEDTSSLDEVVVTGSLVATTKKQLGNAITSLNTKKIVRASTPNVTAALSGKIPGALISQNSGNPAGGVSVRFRGASSVLGSSQPLYLVDGIIVDNSSTRILPLGGYSQNRLVDINPYDIAKIEVIKGASASAIYGSRASSGVVQIFTKQGTQGAPSIEYSANFKMNQVQKFIEENQEPFRFASNKPKDPGYNKKITANRYNYQDMIFRQAYGTEHNISISGGDDKTKFYTSGSFMTNGGIIKNTDFDRYTFRANISNKFSDWLKVFVTSYYANSKSNEMPNGGTTNDVVPTGEFFGVLTGFSFINNYHDLSRQADGSYNYPFGFISNPIAALDNYKFQLLTNRFIGGMKLQLDISENLVAEYVLGYDGSTTRGTGYIPPIGLSPKLTGWATTTEKTSLLLNNNVLLTYNVDISENIKSSSSLGATQQYDKITFLENRVDNLTPNISSTTAGNIILRQDSSSERSIQGSFFQQSLGFFDKIFVTGALRVDRASTFGEKERMQIYPKASLSYAISDESFWKENINEVINVFKIRMSYGESGNMSALGAYDKFTKYNPLSYIGQTALISDLSHGNKNIKPERQKQLEVGFDTYSLNGRIGLEFTYYNMDVQDLLLSRVLAPSSGYLTSLQNVGTLTNKGIEVLLKGQPIFKKDFSWDVSVIYSHNRNKVNNIEGGSVPLPGGFDGLIIAKNDYPIGVFQGSYFVRDNFGEIAIDGNGLPITSPDKKIIGDPNPKWTGSLTNEFTLKNWSLSFQFDAVMGFDVFNWTNRLKAHTDLFGGGRLDAAEVRGDLLRGYNTSTFQTFERYVEDGSFVKLRELFLNYSFDLKPSSKLKGLSLYLSGRNLITFTNYSGWDPEVSSFGQTNGVRGQDFNAVPLPRIFELGIKINF